MAGRGRGRGFRANFSLDSEQPTPLYPPLEQKPLPLSAGEQVDYLLALKQEFRGASKSLSSFLQPKVSRRDVERYSDKYQDKDLDRDLDWTPDWSRFPKELRVRPLKPRPPCPKVKVSSRSESKKDEKLKDVLQKLETLEQKEAHTDEEEEEEEKKAEEEEAEEEQVDEDEFEEDTDYIMSYFDNGEEFGADSDDNMDEAIY